jgi:hypothetical protein
MKLSEYLATRQIDERRRFCDIVASLEVISHDGKSFCSNLQEERQPGAESWRVFVDYMMTASSDDIAYKITLHIRQNSQRYQLRGNLDPAGETECLTRLVSLAALVDLVVDQDTDGMLPLDVIAYLRSEVVDKDTGLLSAWFVNLRLGLFLIWGALGLDVPNDRTSAARAACRCGLPREIEAGPIVCLRYRLPPDVCAHAPTIFDAYGGWPWPRHFRVGNWNGTFFAGNTEPRAECASEAGFREVVSAPVLLSCLCEPIRLAE